MQLGRKILYPFIILLFVYGLTNTVYSIEEIGIDNLQVQLLNSQEDTIRINILLELAEENRWTDIKSTEKYAKEALLLSQQYNYLKGIAYSNYWLSKVYVDSEFELSESLILESLKYAKAINDSILIAKNYNLLGNLLGNLDHKDVALDYYNKSLDIYLRHKQDSSAAAIYSNLGVLLGKDGDSLSINYFLKAAEINKRTKNHLWLAINFMNIGAFLLKVEKFEQGFDYLQLSSQIADEYTFKGIFPWLNLNLSDYYYKTKDNKKAISYANKSLQFSRELDDRLTELGALNRLKDVYEDLMDYKKAFAYSELIKTINDSINKHDRLKELNILELRYKFEEERKQFKIDKELQQAKHERQQMIYVFIILGTGFLLTIFVLLYFVLKSRVRRKILEKEKLSKDLELKNKELTTGVIYSIQKNKVLTTLTEELVEIENNAAKEETRDAINQISQKIKESIEANAWEEFEIRFQQVHISFYDKLSKEYPDLTPNEKRLCAFLRLDMSSKEISKVTGQSVSALEMARIRLRKKLGISNKDINLVTLLSQY